MYRIFQSLKFPYHWSWCALSVISTFRKQRQEDLKFDARYLRKTPKYHQNSQAKAHTKNNQTDNWNPRQISYALVAYLTPRPSTSILPALLKACIPVCAYDPVIQTGSVYVPHRILRVCSRIVSCVRIKDINSTGSTERTGKRHFVQTMSVMTSYISANNYLVHVLICK